MIVGLTGGSGTGKSTVTEIFLGLGYIVIDPDKIYADVIAPKGECIGEIEDIFTLFKR